MRNRCTTRNTLGACSRGSLLKTDCCTNCSELIGKDEWPLNSPNVNLLDYHVWGVIGLVEHYKTFHPKPKNTVFGVKICDIDHIIL